MNVYSSPGGGNGHAPSFNGFVVRSFRPADRSKVFHFHSAAAMGSMPCDCAAKIDQIEEKYLTDPQNHFWVAEAEGDIIGTVGICVQNEVANLHCLRTIDGSMSHVIRKGLVRVAANHAHECGCLKLVLHAQVEDVARAAEFLHRLGFEFSRQREVPADPVCEFYLNLYERPELLPTEDAAVQMRAVQ
jgi:N-acetylglutamate synthase-like GNAT family acetyltransferase